ncbi:MAG: efflux RND transporter periplasmic adaptor subunit [Verrucomicrobiales bacterium]|nr:efflux RND transporter periplasmic adaptor subunit [Verrucomicrobiales bacterium]
MSDSNKSSKSSRRSPVLIALFAVLLIGVTIGIVKLIQAAPNSGQGGPGAGGKSDGPPPAAVFVESVKLEAAQNQSLATGTLRATSRADVAAREPEAVVEVLADEGDTVKAGDVLVKLNGDKLNATQVETEAQLRTAKKLVNQRNAELERAKIDLEMKEGLLNDRAISKSEFLDAQSLATVANAQAEAATEMVSEAASRLELLKIRQKDLEIKAPFAGLIAGRHVEPGEWVAAGAPVMTLVTIDPVEAWMQVPERFLRDVNEQPMEIRVKLSSAGEVHAPTAVKIVPDVDRRSQLFTVVATLANPKGQLAPGQSITGSVPVGKKEDHFHFPVDALQRSRLGDFIFVVAPGESGEAMPTGKKVPVQVHFERDGRVFVKAEGTDLKAGDRVVVEGNDRLQPGQPLLIREEGEGAPQVKP